MRRHVVLISMLLALTPKMASAQSGHFDGPINATWMADGRHMILEKAITFTDSKGRAWPVPAGTETDGASIPQAFWWIIGGPFEGPYREAAVIHDYYCDTRRRSWQDVDNMFYDAMLSSNVPAAKAKAMFYAVWSQGPHWDDQALNNVWLAYPSNGGPSLIAPPVVALVQTPQNTPVLYAQSKAISLQAHDTRAAQMVLDRLADLQVPHADLSTAGRHPDLLSVAVPNHVAAISPSNDPQDIAENILKTDPSLADVQLRAEATRLTAAAQHP